MCLQVTGHREASLWEQRNIAVKLSPDKRNIEVKSLATGHFAR